MRDGRKPPGLLVALADAAPNFRLPAHSPDGAFARRLLVALADAAPAFRQADPDDAPAKRPATGREGGLFEPHSVRGLRYVLVALICWLVLSTAGDALGSQPGGFSRAAALFGLLILVVLAPVTTLALLVRSWRYRSSATTPPPIALGPSPWRRPTALHGRDPEVERGLELVRDTGMLVVAGPRGVGTSTVAGAVIARLIDSGRVEPNRIIRYDLHGRSNPRPAGWASGRYDIVLLDNAAAPEDVEPVIRMKPPAGPRWLIIAGESTLGTLVPHSTVRIWPAEPSVDDVRAGLSADALWLLHVLAELPVTARTRDAISAVLTARGKVSGDPLEELRIRNLVEESDGRYRLPVEVRRTLGATTTEEDRGARAREAVPALVRHYAQQVTRWAARLTSDAIATDWFGDAEPSLRPLFDTDGYRDERLLELVIDDLASIARALEVWYVREQLSEGLLAVNDAVRELAERAGRLDLAGSAAIRMAIAHRMAGRRAQAGRMLDVAAEYASRVSGPAAAELAVRQQVERAWLAMLGSDEMAVLRAKGQLERIVVTRKPEDRTDVTAALIALGALCMRRDLPDEALDYLRLAERMADDRGDLGSKAQAVELQGVVLAYQLGLPLGAVPLWQWAITLFVHIGDAHGEARCLRYLGSAALDDPRVAGLLRDGHPTELDAREAAEVAQPLLARAKALMQRAGLPDTRRVDDLLREASSRLG
ncbi:MAG TPA: hypothetical protein VGX25_03545 [Actinophytocola sp.]|uniref:hypothetical protein n=1 Tax=Actinophytocola sp. TaxID=1872138 RepID=UPI002DDD0A42|nr:hypothetical protein [Actinophytocola sp.]HEV2778452.1 hypothetical protein [Actinophytocola sp.]